MHLLFVSVIAVAIHGLVLTPNLEGQAPGPPSAPDARVRIITTGGTIASRTVAPMVEGHELVRAVPALLEHAQVDVEEFSRIGSSQMTPDHWLRLARRIDELFETDADLDGIVVTHGTDTLEETAFFLNLTVRDPRPVVLVGSMRSSDEISADGSANLLQAVRVAVAPASRGQGVLVVLNEDIAAARDVWKTDNRRVGTFRSPELGFLGVADPDTVMFYRRALKPHTTESEFRATSLTSLPAVAIVHDYVGFDGALVVEAARTSDGVIVATFAGGRMSAGARAGIEGALALGVPVTVASRVPGGRIVGNPTGDLPVLLARDLPPHKARILLMLALATGLEGPELAQVFQRY